MNYPKIRFLLKNVVLLISDVRQPHTHRQWHKIESRKLEEREMNEKSARSEVNSKRARSEYVLHVL